MAKLSAGVLLYRFSTGELQVLLVHPGGPFWRNKDQGAWSIPKGEYGDGEDPLAVAKREFEEELGSRPPAGTYRSLGEVRQRGGKLVTAFAIEGDFDTALARSNTFEIEWPPRSGKRASFPEVDKAAWFRLSEARVKILASQLSLIERLENLLDQ
jgi:predicted NUDIX family NTP pyrophosphohydrolase